MSLNVLLIIYFFSHVGITNAWERRDPWIAADLVTIESGTGQPTAKITQPAFLDWPTAFSVGCRRFSIVFTLKIPPVGRLAGIRMGSFTINQKKDPSQLLTKVSTNNFSLRIQNNVDENYFIVYRTPLLSFYFFNGLISVFRSLFISCSRMDYFWGAIRSAISLALIVCRCVKN